MTGMALPSPAPQRRRTPLAALLAYALLAVGSASASVPSPPDSDIPTFVTLVGTTGGVADPYGEFLVVVRDFAANPIAGATVVVDFSQCEIDIRVCSAQPQAGHTVSCATPLVSAVTDANGAVHMRIVGAAANSVFGAPGEGVGCARMIVDGVDFGPLTVAALDQDGAGGVNPADLSLLLDDFFSGVYKARSDYNGSETLSAVDVSLWLSGYFGDGSTASCGSPCP